MTSLTPFDLATAGALTVRGGSQDGAELELSEPVTRIARAAVRPRHRGLHRLAPPRHRLLRDGTATLLDDNSLNGTCYRDAVTDGVDLRDGDIIRLGAATLRYMA